MKTNDTHGRWEETAAHVVEQMEVSDERLERLTTAVRRLLDDNKLGTLGHGPNDRDEFYCEYCGTHDPDCTKMVHLADCPVLDVLAEIGKGK